MENKEMLQEWLDFAEMDFLTAKHLYNNMYPKPLEIICYHCQQSAEKLLKGILLSYGVTVKKTHDLGLLAEMLQEYVEVNPRYIEICDNLTPYGVKIRYPQELFIEEYHVKKALSETEELYNWLRGLLKTEEEDNQSQDNQSQDNQSQDNQNQD